MLHTILRSLIILTGAVLLGIGGYFLYRYRSNVSDIIVSPLGQVTRDYPLNVYAIDNLKSLQYTGSNIVLDKAVATDSAYTSYIFYYQSQGKKVTGLANIPNSSDSLKRFPVIIQFRGYVDRTIYTPGEGTKRSGIEFAKSGFITLAPDFLGYGGSDMPENNIFEERFETYTTARDLIASIASLHLADPNRVGIWGHSNGGHIALVVLEIMGSRIPTSLWAPVTKPFPYSILYYTDEQKDAGKFLRKKLAEFEFSYDTDRFSLTTYLDLIEAPIQLHQGTSDEAVPKRWSDEFVSLMKEKKKNIVYFVHEKADHNMAGSWDLAVKQDIDFFKRELK